MENKVAEKPSILDRILDGLRDIFAPNLIALSAAGILQGLVILLHTFGVIQYDTAEDFILTRISDAIFYFLPVLLANSSAKVFKTNSILAMAVALFLLHPDVVESMDYASSADFFGIPLIPGTYTNSVIPIILIVWAQSYIERFVVRILPNLIRGVFMPVLVLAFTAIVGIVLLGPIGTFLGDLMGAGIGWLNQYANWLVTTILGAFGLFVVMAGGHYSLFPIVTQTLAQDGYESFLTPGLLPSNLALAGAVAAVILKTKNEKYRAYSVSATVTAMLGVSQPALYGVALPMKKVLIASMIGGGIGGLYAGLVGFVSYAFAIPGIAALPAFIATDSSFGSLLNGVIIMVGSFLISFAIVFFTPYKELPKEQIEQLTAE
ncbi:PTS transporter subunit EIIC [Jeotgalibaca caeni]|uniref:PTS transporter subunit EIIC n=1 Tax=Jeotgalibaca caeni TaxID=3028623 RepID=UPI00237ED921|nr:PTS transporter subunit EIIC [Jeotgalibaca caeni]MDE1548348.1 PTS transporter subunit EIIC [Jeotgalibaca caeni]